MPLPLGSHAQVRGQAPMIRFAHFGCPLARQRRVEGVPARGGSLQNASANVIRRLLRIGHVSEVALFDRLRGL